MLVLHTGMEVWLQMKASDIPDTAMMQAIIKHQKESSKWTTWWDTLVEFPEVPHKVIYAKLKGMARRGLITGCFHGSAMGCRADIEIPDAKS